MDYATKTNRRLHPEERVCIIRTRDGVKMEFRGDDAPSIKSTLLFFKRRKLAAIQAKRANGDKSGDPKQRMAPRSKRPFGRTRWPTFDPNQSFSGRRSHPLVGEDRLAAADERPASYVWLGEWMTKMPRTDYAAICGRNACAREGIQSMNDETDPYDLRLEVNGRSPSTIREASLADLETLGEQLGIQCAQHIFPDASEELSREISATEDASLKFLELENRVR
jgi:hypothetical protein